MFADESVPAWLMVLAVLVGIAIIVCVSYFLGLSRKYSRLPKKRRFAATPQQLHAVAMAAIDKLQYGIYNVTEQTISFSVKVVSGPAVAAPPVVHVAMLATDDGSTMLEVFGSRGPFNFGWHVMAQSFLAELDRRLVPR